MYKPIETHYFKFFSNMVLYRRVVKLSIRSVSKRKRQNVYMTYHRIGSREDLSILCSCTAQHRLIQNFIIFNHYSLYICSIHTGFLMQQSRYRSDIGTSLQRHDGGPSLYTVWGYSHQRQWDAICHSINRVCWFTQPQPFNVLRVLPLHIHLSTQCSYVWCHNGVNSVFWHMS